MEEGMSSGRLLQKYEELLDDCFGTNYAGTVDLNDDKLVAGEPIYIELEDRVGEMDKDIKLND